MREDRTNHMSAELVVRVALAYADEHGLASLSMRKIAGQLGTAPMTLYYHIPSKDRLVDLMVDEVFAQISLPAANAPWKAALRDRCESARAVLNVHRWAAPLMESRTSPGPANLRHHDAVIGCLRSAGFPMPLIAHAYAVLDSFVFGFAFEEATLPAGDHAGLKDMAEQLVGQLENGGLRDLAAFTREHVLQPGYSFAASFDFGLTLILDGLERAKDDPD